MLKDQLFKSVWQFDNWLFNLVPRVFLRRGEDGPSSQEKNPGNEVADFSSRKMCLDIRETGPWCILIKLYAILQAVAWSYGNAKTSKKVMLSKGKAKGTSILLTPSISANT